MNDEAATAGMILVVNMTPDRKRRHWLRPKLYLLPTSSGEQAWLSPWPFGMEWQASGGEDRRCVRCGYLHPPGNGSVYRDPDGIHCPQCHDLLHPHVPVQPSRLRLTWWRLKWRLWGWFRVSERTDALYLRWCKRFGTQVVQQEPPMPGSPNLEP